MLVLIQKTQINIMAWVSFASLSQKFTPETLRLVQMSFLLGPGNSPHASLGVCSFGSFSEAQEIKANANKARTFCSPAAPSTAAPGCAVCQNFHFPTTNLNCKYGSIVGSMNNVWCLKTI